MNRFKRLMYEQDKHIFAKQHGYIDHYEMIKQEYIRLNSQIKVSRLMNMSQQHISATLLKMGVKTNPRGGANFKGNKH